MQQSPFTHDTYLLNSPFTFQSMEKPSAYCAMMRLGLKVPKTVLVPDKNPVDNVRWAYTSEQYNDSFDLEELAEEIGYPLYMKPFDGGGWRGVSRVDDKAGLHKSYDESGEMLMHLHATVDYDYFARALSIGPETMVMDFRPGEPMHNRYALTHDFLSDQAGWEAETVSKVVNAFFGWEFNSAEMLLVGNEVPPIDYAIACPDVALTSLHYYFPGPPGPSSAGPPTPWSPAVGARSTWRRGTSSTSPPTRRSSTTTRCWATGRWRTSTSRPTATGTGVRTTCRTCLRPCWSGSSPPSLTSC